MNHRKFYVHASADEHDALNWWLYAQPWLFKGTPLDKYALQEKQDLPDYFFIKDFFLQVYGLQYVYVDVGANIGLSALGLAKAGVQVIAFEPVQENIKLLERSIVENAVLHTIYLHPVALGKAYGEETIYVPVNADNSSMNKDIAVVNMKDKKYQEERVLVEPFDALFMQQCMFSAFTPDVRMIKIDVQGYEQDVLEGMEQFLRTCARGTSLLLELDDKLLTPRGHTAAGIIRLLDGWGFSCHKSLSSLDKMFLKR